VANDVGADQVGFAHDTNAVTLISSHREPRQIPLASKAEIATAVWDAILDIRTQRSTTS
jgi:phosphopantothenoylcysteine decarboxylase / phosphopantothenate---cysteine ligase